MTNTITARENRQAAQRAYNQTTESQYRNVREGYGALIERQAEERTALSQSVDEITRRAGQAAGAFLANTGGTSGAAIAASLRSVYAARNQATQSAILSQQFRERQHARSAEGLRSNAYQTILDSMARIPAKGTVAGSVMQDLTEIAELAQLLGAL